MTIPLQLNDPLPAGVRCRLALRDAYEFLEELGPESVDLIVTDPPYWTLEKHRAVGTTTRLQEWFPVIDDTEMDAILSRAETCLRPGGHMYIFGDQDFSAWVRDWGSISPGGGAVFHKWLVWDKEAIGMGYHYRAQHELISFLSKPGPKRRLRNLGMSDVLRCKRVSAGDRRYPTEKPVPLLRALIQQSSEPGEIVCDPFLGSGSTAVAALEEGRRFVGCDVEVLAVEAALVGLEGVSGVEVDR